MKKKSSPKNGGYNTLDLDQLSQPRFPSILTLSQVTRQAEAMTHGGCWVTGDRRVKAEKVRLRIHENQE